MITVDAPDVSMWTDQGNLPTSHGSIVWIHHKRTVAVLIALHQEVFVSTAPARISVPSLPTISIERLANMARRVDLE